MMDRKELNYDIGKLICDYASGKLGNVPEDIVFDIIKKTADECEEIICFAIDDILAVPLDKALENVKKDIEKKEEAIRNMRGEK